METRSLLLPVDVPPLPLVSSVALLPSDAAAPSSRFLGSDGDFISSSPISTSETLHVESREPSTSPVSPGRQHQTHSQTNASRGSHSFCVVDLRNPYIEPRND